MALLGTLKGFGVTEIFQLISQQMKTGSLFLSSSSAKVSIAFNDGIIKGIVSDQWETDPRAELLVKGGYIREQEFKVAGENIKKNAPPWHEVLISQGRLQQVILDKAGDVIIKGILIDVFQWGDGTYRFDDWATDTDGMLACHIPTESIILNTLRIIDEWPVIKPKIPPTDYSPVTIMPLTQQLVKDNDLDECAMRVFDLIDGTKTIETIVRQSLEAPVDVLSSFVKLIDANLVEVFPQPVKERHDLSSARNIIFGYIKRVSVFVLLGLVVAGLFMAGSPTIREYSISRPAIKNCLDNQRTIAEGLAKRGITLSGPDKDMYDP
ncbi:MAG: DUF4388 domain-containing protein [Thermodesulfobacteriota bacterium]|nr:DUF4388 domain-containing protein [Thermodesulfobacteriota bacterium]